MEIISSFRREARLEGKREFLTMIIEHRLGSLSVVATEKLNKLIETQLHELAVELLTIKSLAEVEEWLSMR